MNALISSFDRGTALAIAPMAIAGAAWLLAIVASLLSRSPQPKKGFRLSEIVVIGTSCAFALSAMATFFAVRAMESKPVAGAAAKPAQASLGTCASLRVGMRAADVRREMGEPDEIRSEEDVRGPEAQAWVYRASRCSVHVLSGKVDFID